MVIFDTSIIIDHLRQPAGTETLFFTLAQTMPKENLAISIISVQELYEGRSVQEKSKEDALLATITPLKILPYTYEIAQTAGELARDHAEVLAFTDAAIAATAMTHGAVLCTLNRKDFQNIEGLELYKT